MIFTSFLQFSSIFLSANDQNPNTNNESDLYFSVKANWALNMFLYAPKHWLSNFLDGNLRIFVKSLTFWKYFQ